MSYATPEQFIRAFSEREACTLTDEEMTGLINEEKLAPRLRVPVPRLMAIWWGVTGPRGLTARGFWWVTAAISPVITWRPITVSAQKKFRCATGTPSAFWRKSRQDKSTSGGIRPAA